MLAEELEMVAVRFSLAETGVVVLELDGGGD